MKTLPIDSTQTPPVKRGYHKALLAMTAAAFLWALVELLGKSVPRGFSPVQIVWSRYLFHILFMLAVFAPRSGSRLVRTHRLGLQISRSLLMVGMPACFIMGVLVLPFNSVWLISWSCVPMLLMLSRLLLGERPTPGAWMAVVIGGLGVWAMYDIQLPPISWRYLPALGMGFCFALYAIMTRRMNHEKTQVKLFHTAFWVLLVLAPALPFVWKTPSLKVLALYAGIGVIGYAGLYFLDKSIESAPVYVTFPFLYTVPIWDRALEFAISGQFPGLMALLGGAIIATAMAVIFLNARPGRVAQVPVK